MMRLELYSKILDRIDDLLKKISKEEKPFAFYIGFLDHSLGWLFFTKYTYTFTSPAAFISKDILFEVSKTLTGDLKLDGSINCLGRCTCFFISDVTVAFTVSSDVGNDEHTSTDKVIESRLVGDICKIIETINSSG